MLKKSTQIFHSLAIIAFALALASFAATGANGAQHYLTLAVSEGTSGSRDPFEIIRKYQAFADMLGKGGRPIRIVAETRFADLEAGMKEDKYDFVMARPADYPARGVRDYGYRPLAKAKGSGTIVWIAPQTSPIKTINDIANKRVMLPEEAAYAYKVALASMSGAISLKSTRYSVHKEQDVIAYAVNSGMADVGAVMTYSKPGREWEKSGGRIIHRGKELPYQPVIASKRVTQADFNRIRDNLIALSENDDGKAILKAAGLPAFETLEDKAILSDLLAYLDRGNDVAVGATPVNKKD